jgi:hypothetical protein
MDRGSTPAFQAELVKAQNRPVHLVEVDFDSGSVFMTDSFKAITFAGDEYQAVGNYMGFSDIEETADIIVSNVTLSLSGVDQVWISNVLNENFIDRKVKIWTGFVDDAFDLISDPVIIFEGRMNQPTINENPSSGESTVSVSCTNAWVDFARKTGRHTNHEEQQIHFPNDKGFEFASEIVKDMTWGKA